MIQIFFKSIVPLTIQIELYFLQIMSFADLSPYFLIPFFKNDISVKDFCKLNSAFCNKLDRPHLQNCLTLNFKLRDSNSSKNEILWGFLTIRSKILHTYTKMKLFNFVTSEDISFYEKWEALDKCKPWEIYKTNAIGVSTTLSELLIPIERIQDSFMFWNRGISYNKETKHSTTDEGLITKVIYSVGLFITGQFERSKTHAVAIKHTKRKISTCNSDTAGCCATYIGHIDGQSFFSGQGTMTYSDGCTYSGSWKNDKFHGDGVFTYPEGRVDGGSWVEGRLYNTARFECMKKREVIDLT